MKRRRRRKEEAGREGEISSCQMVSNKTSASSISPGCTATNLLLTFKH